MLQSFAAWLDATQISAAMTGYPWLWPVCETLHFMGLTLLVGVTGVLDLRLLGFARGLPIRTIQRLIPWAVGASWSTWSLVSCSSSALHFSISV